MVSLPFAFGRPVNFNLQGDHLQCNDFWLTVKRTCRLQVSPVRSFKLISIQLLACLNLAAVHSVSGQESGAVPNAAPVRGSSIQLNAPIADSPGEPLRTGLSWAQETYSGNSPVSSSPVSSSPVSSSNDLSLLEAQGAESGQVRQVTQERRKNRPEQEVIFEGLVSYGNYRIFASGYDEKLYTAGVEYDRHSWGSFLGAQVDYVAEILPFILLNKPRGTDIWGNPVPFNQRNIRQLVPGVGITPIGFRMQWRSSKAIRPFLEAKGGIIGFTKKVPSTEASYENFSLQTSTGVQVRLNDRWGVRLGLFGDFHFSNGFVVPVDPGLDVMNASVGVSYHF